MARKTKAKKPGRARKNAVKNAVKKATAKKAARTKAASAPKKTGARRRTEPARTSRSRQPGTESGGAVSRAWRTMLDTFSGTNKLRNKLEPRGSDETE
jgi:hypothetical protein